LLISKSLYNIYPNRDTLLSQFIEEDKIDYSLIIQKLLLPFFKIKQRILKEDFSFQIGEIAFKVSGLNPFRFGFVSSKTYIRLNSFFTVKEPIQRALLLTSKYLLNFSDKDLIAELQSEPFPIIKNEICEVKNFEFFIKNCEPESGVVNKDTVISVENKQLNLITKIQLGIIKSNTPMDFDFEEELNYQHFIHQQIYKPYFLSGVRRYIERGDIIKIDNIEMFVLNSLPENGFINQNTQVYYKYNMSKEQCLEKINKLDIKYAMQIAQSNSNDSINVDFENRLEFDTNNRLVINSNNINEVISRILSRDANDREFVLNEMRRRRNYLSSGEMVNLSVLQLSSQKKEHTEEDIELFIHCLPELIIDKDYIDYIASKKKTIEENISKCMICFEDFELDDVLKTLPCSKLTLIKINKHKNSSLISFWLYS